MLQLGTDGAIFKVEGDEEAVIADSALPSGDRQEPVLACAESYYLAIDIASYTAKKLVVSRLKSFSSPILQNENAEEQELQPGQYLLC